MRVVFFSVCVFLFSGSSVSAESGTGVRVRKSPLAGAWYLGDAKKLRHRLELYLARAGSLKIKGRPLALVSPHAGVRYSGQAAAYGFKTLAGRGIRRVIILGASHHVAYNGASVPAATHYETPLGRVAIDQASVKRLLAHPLFSTRPDVHAREHSVEMQIPFLQTVLEAGFQIVPVVFGALEKKDYPKAARALRALLDDRTVVIASSDFMHYGERFGYQPFTRNVAGKIEVSDKKALSAILDSDFEEFYAYQARTRTTICGRVPIGVLLQVLGKDAQGSLLRYYRSGDLTGVWNGSVSYASVVFAQGARAGVSFQDAEKDAREEAMLNPAEQRQILALARATVDAYVRQKKIPDTEGLSEKIKQGLEKKRGVFVTLKKQGHLRGCIGSIIGVAPLYKGIVSNAVNACAFDRRFQPVTADELDDIELEVSVLSPLKKITGHDQIIPGWHGVVLSKGRRQAVFLPQVAMEFNWEVEEMLTHLARKAGLSAEAWKEGATFEIFEAQIIAQ